MGVKSPTGFCLTEVFNLRSCQMAASSVSVRPKPSGDNFPNGAILFTLAFYQSFDLGPGGHLGAPAHACHRPRRARPRRAQAAASLREFLCNCKFEFQKPTPVVHCFPPPWQCTFSGSETTQHKTLAQFIEHSLRFLPRFPSLPPRRCLFPEDVTGSCPAEVVL